MPSDIEHQKARPLRVAVVGLGEVGSAFAATLKDAGADVTLTAARPSEKARAAAEGLGLPLQEDLEAAVRGVQLVLLAVVGGALVEATRCAAPALSPDAVFADLTAASPADIATAAALAPPQTYVDVAINGAVSLHGARTPLLAAGPRAGELAAMLNPLGFNVQAQPDWAVGDASKLKLVRSVFTKGLELVLIEALLAAEKLNIRPALMENIKDYDARTIREHTDMYLRTHVGMAPRRIAEMRNVLELLEASHSPTSVTEAVIARYQRTIDLAAGREEPKAEAESVFAWLARAEG